MFAVTDPWPIGASPTVGDDENFLGPVREKE
jgi:hypothetical protein